MKNRYIATAFCSFALINIVEAANLYSQDGTSFDIFGRVRAFFANQNEVNESFDNYNDSSLIANARLGISGRSQITEGFDAVTMALFDFDSQKRRGEESIEKVKYLFAGFDAYQYGTLLFGRGDGAFYTVVGGADIYSYFKTRANDYYILGEQQPSQLMYSLSAGTFDFRASYLLKSSRINENQLSVDRGYSFAVSGKINKDFTLAYGINYVNFAYRNRDNIQMFSDYFAPMYAKDKKLSTQDAIIAIKRGDVDYKYDYGAALSYGVLGRDFYSSLVFTKTDYENFEHNFYTYELAMNYTMQNGLGFNVGYATQLYNGNLLVSDAILGLSYTPTSSFKVFAEAQIDIEGNAKKLYDSNVAKRFNQNKFVLGAEFNF